jgi:hypothetical protein
MMYELAPNPAQSSNRPASTGSLKPSSESSSIERPFDADAIAQIERRTFGDEKPDIGDTPKEPLRCRQLGEEIDPKRFEELLVEHRLVEPAKQFIDELKCEATSLINSIPFLE